MSDQDTPKTLDLGETIEAALEAEGVSFLSDTGNPARTPRAAVLSAVEKIAQGTAAAVRIAEAAYRSAWQGIALDVLRLRSRFVTADGRRDWNGSTAVYKAVVPMIVSAACSDPEDALAFTRTRDTVQKTAVRMLPRFVLQWVAKEDGLSVSAAEMDRLVGLIQPKTTTPLSDVVSAAKKAAKKQADDTAKQLLARLAEELSSSAKRNAKKGPPTEPAGNDEAVENRDAVPTFSVAIAAKTVPVNEAASELRASARALFGRVMRRENVSFGDGGRGAVETDLLATAQYASLLAKYVAGKSLTAEESAGILALEPDPDPEPKPEAKPEAETPKPEPKKTSGRKRQNGRKREKVAA